MESEVKFNINAEVDETTRHFDILEHLVDQRLSLERSWDEVAKRSMLSVPETLLNELRIETHVSTVALALMVQRSQHLGPEVEMTTRHAVQMLAASTGL